jgi:hypothetical protein
MKRLFICVPGDNFSGRFLDCWTDFLSRLQEAGYAVAVSRAYLPVVGISRLKCLGGSETKGKIQQPFSGAGYDWILWIDSDMVWSFAEFATLMASAERTQSDIIGGLYLMADGRHFACTETVGKHLTPAEINGRTDPFPVAFNGLGFALVRCGVFERLPWPWFCGDGISEDGKPRSEDVLFAHDCREAGLQIMVDPTVIVGHEKRMVLRP